MTTVPPVPPTDLRASDLPARRVSPSGKFVELVSTLILEIPGHPDWSVVVTYDPRRQMLTWVGEIFVRIDNSKRPVCIAVLAPARSRKQLYTRIEVLLARGLSVAGFTLRPETCAVLK